MIRVVDHVRKGAGKTDRGSELKNGSNTHIGWGAPKNGYDLVVNFRNLLACNTVRPRGSISAKGRICDNTFYVACLEL